MQQHRVVFIQPHRAAQFKAASRAAALGVMAAVAGACQPLPANSPSEASAGEAAAEQTAQAPAPAASPTAAAEQAAIQDAQNWLSMIDQKQYDASWQAASDVFKSSITTEKWADAVSGARSPLGELSSRKLLGSEFKTELPGAPEGEYVVIHYDSAFTNKPAAKEIVTTKHATDGSWRVAGYFVQ